MVGVPGSPDIVRLPGLLTQSGYPNIMLDERAIEGQACAAHSTTLACVVATRPLADLQR